MKKSVKFVVVCAAPLLAAGIALPSASADPTDAPGPGPTVANQPPGAPPDHLDGPVGSYRHLVAFPTTQSWSALRRIKNDLNRYILAADPSHERGIRPRTKS